MIRQFLVYKSQTILGNEKKSGGLIQKVICRGLSFYHPSINITNQILRSQKKPLTTNGSDKNNSIQVILVQQGMNDLLS
jgi:hypothetical protein